MFTVWLILAAKVVEDRYGSKDLLTASWPNAAIPGVTAMPVYPETGLCHW
jgi:hypothetical protein